MDQKTNTRIMIAVGVGAIAIILFILWGLGGGDREGADLTLRLTPEPTTPVKLTPTPAPTSPLAEEDIINLELPEEVRQAINDALFADSLRQSKINFTLMTSLSPDPEPREGYYRTSLSELMGRETQALRILLWVRETEPSLRKELLTQWLMFQDPQVLEQRTILAQQTKVRLMALLEGRTNEAVLERMREFDEVCMSFGEIAESRKELKIFKISERPILGLLDEKVLLADPPSNEQRRRAMYESMPPIVEYESLDYALLGIYQLLWLYEPSATLRKEVLLPALKIIGPLKAYDNYVEKEIKPLLVEMTEEEKMIRLAEMLAVFPAKNPDER